MISYLLKVQDWSVDNAFAGKCEDQSLYAKHTNKAYVGMAIFMQSQGLRGTDREDQSKLASWTRSISEHGLQPVNKNQVQNGGRGDL